jgi:general secretion pathway protein K
VPQPGGLEDGVTSRGAPYRPSNTLLADESELAAVQGFTAEVRRRIARFACVRPTTAPSQLNPNTLRPDRRRQKGQAFRS